MPAFLKSISFSVLLIGILEGLADATAGLSKGYFGKLSDDTGKRIPFIRYGYLFSALAKPMMAVLTFPVWIFSARTFDKLGKGIRTSARDAMLSDEATPQTKGKVFGFHRAFDTLGAVCGPLLALLYLHFYPANYKTMFLLAFAPGILTVFLTFFIKDKEVRVAKERTKTSFTSFLHYWKDSSTAYKKLLIGLLLFALFNSSDMFLLLKFKEVAHDDSAVIKAYIFYNIIYALASFPLGALGDKLSLKTVFIIGLGIFSLVYMGMAFSENIYLCYGLFFLYGIFSAATEGISKAWITNVSDKKDTATAIGTYTAFQSICTMLASFIAGYIWWATNGATVTFLLTATVTLGVMVYFSFLKKQTD